MVRNRLCSTLIIIFIALILLTVVLIEVAFSERLESQEEKRKIVLKLLYITLILDLILIIWIAMLLISSGNWYYLDI